MPIDVQYKLAKLNDVPDKFVRYTNGNIDIDSFIRSGLEVFSMLNLAAQKYHLKAIRDFERILDFGCGAGRVMQFIPDGPCLYGCDVNAELVEYMRHAFPNADMYQNEFTPPLKYQDQSFDLVYAFSVFSHLTLENEKAWLKELHRVGKSGCLYLLTVQGDWMIEQTLGSEREAAEQAGFYYRTVHSRHNSPMDFPDGYESSYHTSGYIKNNWNNFEILDVIKGDDPRRYLWNGLEFQPEGTVPPFRAMGQDLVVMRRT